MPPTTGTNGTVTFTLFNAQPNRPVDLTVVNSSAVEPRTLGIQAAVSLAVFASCYLLHMLCIFLRRWWSSPSRLTLDDSATYTPVWGSDSSSQVPTARTSPASSLYSRSNPDVSGTTRQHSVASTPSHPSEASSNTPAALSPAASTSSSRSSASKSNSNLSSPVAGSDIGNVALTKPHPQSRPIHLVDCMTNVRNNKGQLGTNPTDTRYELDSYSPHSLQPELDSRLVHEMQSGSLHQLDRENINEKSDINHYQLMQPGNPNYAPQRVLHFVPTDVSTRSKHESSENEDYPYDNPNDLQWLKNPLVVPRYQK